MADIIDCYLELINTKAEELASLKQRQSVLLTVLTRMVVFHAAFWVTVAGPYVPSSGIQIRDKGREDPKEALKADRKSSCKASLSLCKLLARQVGAKYSPLDGSKYITFRLARNQTKWTIRSAILVCNAKLQPRFKEFIVIFKFNRVSDDPDITHLNDSLSTSVFDGRGFIFKLTKAIRW